jgi:hypothetical protein
MKNQILNPELMVWISELFTGISIVYILYILVNAFKVKHLDMKGFTIGYILLIIFISFIFYFKTRYHRKLRGKKNGKYD